MNKLAILILGAVLALACHCPAEDVPKLTGAYVATVVSVHDGDTLRVNIDLGFGIQMRNTSIRLVGVYAPELGQPGGTEATATLMELLPIGSSIILRPVMTVTATPPHEVMTFQRYVGRIWRGDLDICEAMNRFLSK